ncbi:hypothetical protein IQ07DRAFT_586426 [Pyrenochaeta sp. DS3sAY3a]|nr:hypothetical protein IQ07DRAFT_586426 [Pyrenochaeta sp. DS3sAY3a]
MYLESPSTAPREFFAFSLFLQSPRLWHCQRISRVSSETTFKLTILASNCAYLKNASAFLSTSKRDPLKFGASFLMNSPA